MKNNTHHQGQWRSNLLCALVAFLPFFCFGQENERLRRIESQLDSLAAIIPALETKTTISLRDVSLAEYVRAIGLEHDISVYIRETPGIQVTSNLINEPVKSVFLFVCRHFSYEIIPSGSILEFVPYQPPAPEENLPAKKPLSLKYEQNRLSCDLKNDSLYRVLKELSQLTGRKLITKPGTEGMLTAYLPPTSLDTALEAIFTANGFYLTSARKGFQIVEPIVPTFNNNVQKTANTSPRQGRTDIKVETFTDAEEEYLTLEADEADLETLIREMFEELSSDYLIYERLEGVVSIHAEITHLDEMLKYLLQGTPYTFRREGNLYLIGSLELTGLQTIRVMNMNHRPTFQAIDLIPGAEPGTRESPETGSLRPVNPMPQRQNYLGGGNGDSGTGTGMFSPGIPLPEGHAEPPAIARLQVGGVEIVEYPELNRIILKGPVAEVDEIADFLEEIDEPVPMVKVEMIVVEVNKNRLISTGIKAGPGGNPDSTRSRNLIPGIDYSTDGEEINNLLSNVPGLSPIGLLDDDFYLQLRALESRGNVKVQMKPVLSMLNGREASLTIGQTQYFLLETQTASTGAVSNFQQFTQRFERIDANITLSIRPYISDGEMVTLDVIPDFTTPVGTFDSKIPPTIATRRFISSIRVKDGETVILGGLSQEEKRENTSGLPLLSRIPVLKWIFGNVDKQKAETSLLIYITPTVQWE